MPNPNRKLTRRRTLQLFAASAALAGGGALARQENLYRWRGVALGADAEMTLRCENADRAAEILEVATREIARLEAIFSLYRKDSALSALNREGWLASPPPELLEVLSISGAVHHATSGAFDPAVQALWAYHAEVASGVAEHDPARLTQLVETGGWRNVAVSSEAIELASQAAALTLNGVAQGYISDRVAALMRASGMTNVLVGLGEIVALGRRSSTQRWRVGLAGDNEASFLNLENEAIATSAPLATTFDEAGELAHIIDPRSGLPARSTWRQASVIHSSAAIADALSTGAALLDQAAIKRALQRFDGAHAVLFDASGVRMDL